MIRQVVNATGRMIEKNLAKSLGLVAAAGLVGILDDLQVRYLRIEDLGNLPEIMYQVLFMLITFSAAFLILRSRGWSKMRNLSNLLMAVPFATIADNVSIDAGTLKPYVLGVPREGFVWRQSVFGGTPVLSQMAGWVNQQTLLPGVLNGYVVAIWLAAAYLAIQYLWSVRSLQEPARVGVALGSVTSEEFSVKQLT